MTPRVSRRRVLQGIAATFGALAARPALARDTASSRPGAPIIVNARPIPSFDPRDPSHVRIGSLRYRGGMVLTSPFKGFGGLSGFRIDPTGHDFTMISDKGTWFTGRLVYNGTVVTGMTDVRTAPMRGSDGNRITARGWFDSESMALDGSLVYVGLERVNKILRFDFGKGYTRALGEEIDAPAAVRKLPFNRGLEAMVVVPRDRPLGGTLIAISERGLDANKNIMAFLIGGCIGLFFRSDGTAIGDTGSEITLSIAALAFLAGYSVEVVFRFFDLLIGQAARLVSVVAPEGQAGGAAATAARA